jgi:hypothetical protein
MLANNFEQCISVAFMAEEDHDYATALSYLIKALKMAKTDSENIRCQSAINLCINELEDCSPHNKDLLMLRRYCIDASTNILS